MLEKMKNSVLPTGVRPFLRWAGGKRQLLPLLHAALPEDFKLGPNRFIEPFIGGGAFMFSLADLDIVHVSPLLRRPLPIIAADVNEELVMTYSAVKKHVIELVAALDELSVQDSDKFFYSIRSKRIDKSDIVDQAARFIYLNRTCFNGLYRVNSKGGFNVPYAYLKKPTILNHQLLLADSEWLQYVQLKHQDFVKTMDMANEGDVVYLDPPYVPLSKTSSFSMYAKGDFGLLEQEELAQKISDLTKRKVRVILSNSMTDQTVEIFSGVIDLYSTSSRRSISASSSSRGRVDEVLGLNFDINQATDKRKLQNSVTKLRR